MSTMANQKMISFLAAENWVAPGVTPLTRGILIPIYTLYYF
jgi:hypothetical protein